MVQLNNVRLNTPRAALPFMMAVGVFFIAVVDSLRRIQVGALTGSSVAGLLITYGLITCVILRLADGGARKMVGVEPALRPRFPVPIAFSLWLAWSLMVTVLSGQLDATIVHPVTMYVGLVAGMWLMAQRSSAGTPDVLLRWMIIASTVLALLFGVQILQYGFEPQGMISRRAFALTAMIAIAFLSAYWARLRSSQKLLVGLLVAEVALSGSRTALLVSAVVLALAAMTRERGQLRVVATRSIAGVGLLYVLVTYWAPLRDRFEEGDGGSFGGLKINTSGREYFWANLMRAFRENPIFGGGIGEAERVMVRYTPNINQPHNDYLRILVDSGIIGLTLFLVGVAALAYRLWRLAFRDDTNHRELHGAALLVLIAFLISAYTDNPLVYPFVLYPMVAIIGCSLSWSTKGSRAKRIRHRPVANTADLVSPQA